MGYSKEIYRATKAKMEERRTKAERRAEQVREEVYRRVPRIEELEKEISSCGILAVRAVLNGGDVKSATQDLRAKSLSMQNEVKKLLKENGYEENCFEPHYNCKYCKDTGYIEKDGRTVYCPCFKRLLVATACEELNRTAPLRLSTFERVLTLICTVMRLIRRAEYHLLIKCKKFIIIAYSTQGLLRPSQRLYL